MAQLTLQSVDTSKRRKPSKWRTRPLFTIVTRSLFKYLLRNARIWNWRTYFLLLKCPLIGEIYTTFSSLYSDSTDEPLEKRTKTTNKFRENLHGILFALCCYHRCTWDTYVGLDFMLKHDVTSSQFHFMTKMATWSTCGFERRQHGKNTFKSALILYHSTWTIRSDRFSVQGVPFKNPRKSRGVLKFQQEALGLKVSAYEKGYVSGLSGF